MRMTHLAAYDRESRTDAEVSTTMPYVWTRPAD